MPAPLFRFSQLLLVVALCATIGLHWAALQTVAWTQMLMTYSQTATLPRAVKKTFDGQHPCQLCKLVRTGQNQEKKSEYVATVLKCDAVLTETGPLAAPPVRPGQYPLWLGDSASRFDAPPTPPPRA